MTFLVVLIPVLLFVGAAAYVADRYGRRGRTSDDVARREARHRHPSSARRSRRENVWDAALAEQPTSEMRAELRADWPPTSEMVSLPAVPRGRHHASA